VTKECEACKEATKEYLVSAVPFAAMSVGRCPRCFHEDIYPYDLLVGNCWAVGDFSQCVDWFQELIIHNLSFYGKTKKTFNKDVADIENEN